MARQQVSENYARARSGKPPRGPVRDADKSHDTPGFTKAEKSPEKSHIARKTAGKAAGAAVGVTPYGKVAKTAVKSAGFRKSPQRTRTARILPSKDKENVTHYPHSDKRTGSAFKAAGNHSPVLLAEFILGMLIIVVKTITDTAKASYQEAMATAMLQASALTGVFFILFLLASGKRAGKGAAWFGALVDLGVLFTAVNAGALTDFTQLVQGKGLPSGVTLLSTSKPEEFYSTSQNWAETAAPATAGNPGGTTNPPAAPTTPTAPPAGGGHNTNPTGSWWAVRNASGAFAVSEATRALAEAAGTIIGGPFATQAQAQAIANGTGGIA
jgi:hypothetical protein